MTTTWLASHKHNAARVVAVTAARWFEARDQAMRELGVGPETILLAPIEPGARVNPGIRHVAVSRHRDPGDPLGVEQAVVTVMQRGKLREIRRSQKLIAKEKRA